MRPVILLMLLVCLLTIPSIGYAAETVPFTFTHEINSYIETRIIISYSFTQNVTSDAYAAGQSVWQVNVDPLKTSFTTSAADHFTWQLQISYSMTVNQDLTIAVFSGDEAVDSMTLHLKTDHILLNFDISVTEQPEYPTAEELADKSVEAFSNELYEVVAEMRRNNSISSQNTWAQWLLILIVFSGWAINIIRRHIKSGGEES